MTAGYTALNLLNDVGIYQQLDSLTSQLAEGLLSVAKQNNVPFIVNHVGAMFGLFFTTVEEVSSYAHVMQSNVELFNKFYHHMLTEGVYFAPSAFEAGFMSLAHGDREINHTIDAANRFFKTLK